MTAPSTTTTAGQSPTAKGVAEIIGEHSAIGGACAALNDAGWPSVIAGNRITVADRVLALFIAEQVGVSGRLAARWVVYGIDDRRLIRVAVAGQKRPGSNGGRH